MSRVAYLDGKAVECLLELEPKLMMATQPLLSGSEVTKKSSSIRLLLACPSRPVLKTLTLCKFFTKFDLQHCFMTTHDAVVYAMKN